MSEAIQLLNINSAMEGAPVKAHPLLWLEEEYQSNQNTRSNRSTPNNQKKPSEYAEFSAYSDGSYLYKVM